MLNTFARRKRAPLQEKKKEEEKEKWRHFDPNMDFISGSGDNGVDWSEVKDRSVDNIKFGQLKLAMEEILFFTYYWDPVKIPNPTVVYVGSAVGTHIAVVAELFPWFTWHLYDPREHSFLLSGKKNIHIHQEYFTDEIADTYKGRDDIILVTDLRGVEGKQLKEYKSGQPDEADVKYNIDIINNNLESQKRWTLMIRPAIASLKFRFPFAWDFIPKEDLIRNYLKGTVLFQVWGPKKTSETRLIVDPSFEMQQWSVKYYENLTTYHTFVTRSENRYYNPFDGSKNPISPELGLTNDYDSTGTVHIMIAYMKKMNISIEKDDVLNLIRYVIDRCKLNNEKNGYQEGYLRALRYENVVEGEEY